MRIKFHFIFVTLALLTFCGRAVQTVSLSWNASPDPNVAGYKVYYGTASGQYTSVINIENQDSVTISNLSEGATYFFAVTDFDASGDESAFSNEIQYIVPGALVLSGQLVPILNGNSAAYSPVIKFPVAPSHWYEVQASTDLKSWVTIWQTDIATDNNWVQFIDPQASSFPSRFYRLVLH